MKTTRIVQAAVLVAVAAIITSCSSGREYYSAPPRTQANFSLIINPSPSYVVRRSPDGRYFYRLPNGYTYWRGADQRYYLDRRYMSKKYYHHNQYNDWRSYGRRSR
jgi:hypothetical protein